MVIASSHYIIVTSQWQPWIASLALENKYLGSSSCHEQKHWDLICMTAERELGRDWAEQQEFSHTWTWFDQLIKITIYLKGPGNISLLWIQLKASELMMECLFWKFDNHAHTFCLSVSWGSQINTQIVSFVMEFDKLIGNEQERKKVRKQFFLWHRLWG